MDRVDKFLQDSARAIKAVNNPGAEILKLREELETERLRFAGLVDALTGIVYSRPLVDQQIQLEILAAIDAVKAR